MSQHGSMSEVAPDLAHAHAAIATGGLQLGVGYKRSCDNL